MLAGRCGAYLCRPPLLRYCDDGRWPQRSRLPGPECEAVISEKSIIARNTLAQAVVVALRLLSSFAFMPFLIGQFGLAGFGVYVLAASVTGYLGLFDFGVAPTVTKFAAAYAARREHDSLARLVSSAVAYYAAIGIVAAAVLVLISQYGLWVFRLSAVDASLARTLLSLAAMLALFSWPLSVGSSLLAGLQRYDLSARIGALVVAANVAVTAAVLAGRLGPVALLAAVGIVNLCGALASCVLAWRVMGPVRVSVRLVDRAGLTAILGFSWTLFVVDLANLAGDQQTDRLVLGIFSGAMAVGVYEAAAKLATFVSILGAIPTAALIPAASSMDAQSRTDSLRALYLRGSKYTAAFVLPVTIGLMVLAEPLLRHWLGASFAGTALSARVLVSVWLVFPNIAVALPILVGTGRTRFLLLFTVSHAILNVALTLALVRSFGVLGVVLGTAITQFALSPVGWWYTLRVLDIPLRDYARRVLLPTYPLLVVPAGIAWGATASGLTASLSGVAVAGAAAVGAYWSLVYAIGLDGQERQDLRSAIGSLGRRGTGVSSPHSE